MQLSSNSTNTYGIGLRPCCTQRCQIAFEHTCNVKTTYGVSIVSDVMAGTKETIAIAVKKNLFILRRAPRKVVWTKKRIGKSGGGNRIRENRGAYIPLTL